MGQRIVVTPPSRHAQAWRDRAADLVAQDPVSALGLHPGDAVLVLAAHPDDETLGIGATVADLCSAGMAVYIVTLTSGEAALNHVGRSIAGLAARRATEFARACAHLGVSGCSVGDLPDSQLSAHEADVDRVVDGLIRAHRPAHLLATWWDDPHPDHAALGRAAVRAADGVGCGVSGYPIWAQHWSDPAPLFTKATSVTLTAPTPPARAARSAAKACYTSQTEALATDLDAILPVDVLDWDVELLVAP